MISTRRLGKSFGRTDALCDIDIDVAPGECLGLVGLPGSGRSTLLRVLATLVAPTTGTIRIAGVDAVADVYQARRHLTHVGTSGPAGCGLATRDHVAAVHAARVSAAPGRRRSAIDGALARAHLAPAAIVDTLPGEARARLALATALLLQPPVLLLDEPLQSVDVQWHGLFVAWVAEVREAGSTVVAATAEGDPLFSLCNRVERLSSGRLADSGRTGDATTTRMAGQGT